MVARGVNITRHGECWEGADWRPPPKLQLPEDMAAGLFVSVILSLWG